jgi:hypothetical protein
VLGTFSVATACLIVISGHSLLQLLYSHTGSLSYSGVLLDDNSDILCILRMCTAYRTECRAEREEALQAADGAAGLAVFSLLHCCGGRPGPG